MSCVVKYIVKEAHLTTRSVRLFSRLSYSINNACYYVPDNLVKKIKRSMGKIFTQWHSGAKSSSVTKAVTGNYLDKGSVVPPHPHVLLGFGLCKHVGIPPFLAADLALAPHTQEEELKA